MRRLLVVAVVLTVSIGACSSSKHRVAHSSSSSPSTFSSTVPTGAPPTSAPITPLPNSPVPTDPAARQATDALLTEAQLAGFQEIPWTSSPIPQPCSAATATPVLSRFVPATLVGRQFTLASPQAALAEELAVFAAPAVATAAAQSAAGGLNCSDGNLYQPDGTAQPVSVAGPADLRAIVGSDASIAQSWTMQNGELTATALVIVDRRVLIILSFIAPTRSDLAKLPDGKVIAELALADALRLAGSGPTSASSKPAASSSASSSSRH